MDARALWKYAALTYKREVAEPAEKEGAVVPAWSWKAIELHYLYHSSEDHVSRSKMVRQLQLLRSQLETRLVRCENGEREVDKQTADLLLKTIAAESRERVLLEASTTGAGASARGRK